MLTKTVTGVVAALAIMTSTAAFAQHATRSNDYRANDFRSWGGEPMSYGAGHMPRAFYDQEQPGYPQSPPGGGF